MNLSKRVLCWLAPETEKRRRDFRETMNRNMANAEDVTRTVVKMNGHLAEHIKEWTAKK